MTAARPQPDDSGTGDYQWDILITGGEVLDGTGAPARPAEVAVRGDRIAAVRRKVTGRSRLVLDARGCCISPGFVDAHSHSDAYLLLEPSAPSKVMQGITTEIVGQCGASAAPLLGAARLPGDWRRFSYPGRWRSVADYRDLLQRCRPAVNVRLFVGHNTLRRCILGDEPRPADPEELRRMGELLEESLRQGAAGLSSGLVYPPGKFATAEELIELTRIVARHGGVYSTHMRNESQGLARAVSEQLHIARLSGVSLEISHLKLGGSADRAVLDRALAMIDAARREGLEVGADAYPYTASCTDLDILLPEEAWKRGPEHEMNLLWNPDSRRRLVQSLQARLSDAEWEKIIIGTTVDPANRRFRGRNLREVARELRCPPAEAVVQLLIRDRLGTQAIFTGLRQEDVERILALPYVCLGTDAALRSPEGPLGEDHPHPRAYGTFPRFLRLCREGLLPLAEGVRKLTSLPAGRFGLKGRGVVKAGAFADLVVFDPREVTDTATYRRPHSFPTGIRTVIVNGMLTVHEGRLTGRRGGRFLPLAGD